MKTWSWTSLKNFNRNFKISTSAYFYFKGKFKSNFENFFTKPVLSVSAQKFGGEKSKETEWYALLSPNSDI